MKEEILKEAGKDEVACERLRGIIEKVEDSIKVMQTRADSGGNASPCLDESYFGFLWGCL